jgi:hypothetical protein
MVKWRKEVIPIIFILRAMGFFEDMKCIIMLRVNGVGFRRNIWWNCKSGY